MGCQTLTLESASFVDLQPSYLKMPLETIGCNADPAAVAVGGEASRRAAAASFGVAFVHSGSHGGAPEGCFYLVEDDGKTTEVSWNNLGQKTWPDVSSVCQHPWHGYKRIQLDTTGCPAGFRPVRDEAECASAATALLVDFGGSASDGGAPKGCYYRVGDDGKDSEVRWNKRGEMTWHDVASVCEHRRPMASP